MLIKLWNFLWGYLEVRIHGVSPERFINLCCNKRILLWDLREDEGTYYFHITVKNYRKLRPIAKKTGLIPRIHKKHGLPFLLYRYRKHKGFFIGAAICVIFVYIMSLFIWDISFEGGSKYTPELMLKFLKEQNVYTGMRIADVNARGIEEEIRLHYKDIGWVSAEVRGTRLIIKITETNMPAPADPARQPSHMIATKDGIIQGIITRTGTPKVKPGDVVKKGDILVSGVVPIYDDFGNILEKKAVIASASIKSKTYYDYENAFSTSYIIKEYSGAEKHCYYITIGEKKIFIYNPSNPFDLYDIINNNNNVRLTNSFYLPLEYGSIKIREYKEIPAIYTDDEAIALADARLNRYLNQLIEKGVLILEKNVTISIENGVCIAKGRIIVEESGWEYKLVDANEWRIEQTDEYNGNNH